MDPNRHGGRREVRQHDARRRTAGPGTAATMAGAPAMVRPASMQGRSALRLDSVQRRLRAAGARGRRERGSRTDCARSRGSCGSAVRAGSVRRSIASRRQLPDSRVRPQHRTRQRRVWPGTVWLGRWTQIDAPRITGTRPASSPGRRAGFQSLLPSPGQRSGGMPGVTQGRYRHGSCGLPWAPSGPRRTGNAALRSWAVRVLRNPASTPPLASLRADRLLNRGLSVDGFVAAFREMTAAPEGRMAEGGFFSSIVPVVPQMSGGVRGSAFPRACGPGGT